MINVSEKIRSYYKLKTQKSKLQFIPEVIYLLFAIASIIYFGVIGQTRNACLGILAVAILLVVNVVEIFLNLKLGLGFASILLFMVAGGVLLGPCYDLYFKVPIWDDILHGFAGVIFTCLGISFAKGIIKGEQSLWVYVVIGVLISLSISVVWELFEWMGTNCFGLDMQEDTLITKFDSFFLTGSHNDIAHIEDINKTIIHYGDGKVLELDGYLDIGLIDTLGDLINCTVGTLIIAVLLILSGKFKWQIEKIFVPQNGFYKVKNADDTQQSNQEDSQQVDKDDSQQADQANNQDSEIGVTSDDAVNSQETQD